MAAKVYNDITEIFGKTPLVRLNKVTDGAAATVLAKLEFYNPSASVKDRLGIAIVDAAEKSGALKPGGTIVEATSGNTGIALAMVAAARGYKVDPDDAGDHEQGAPDAAPRLRRRAGADARRRGHAGAVEPAPRSIVAEDPRRDPGEAVRERRQPGYPRGHDRPGGLGRHRRRGRHLRRGRRHRRHDHRHGPLPEGAGSRVQIVAVEPEESPILNGGAPGPHKIQGIGANFVPEILDREVYDEVIDVNITQSVAMARRLAVEEGILAGISSGATVTAAVELAKRPENAGKTIVVIVASFGERYLSTVLYEDLVD